MLKICQRDCGDLYDHTRIFNPTMEKIVIEVRFYEVDNYEHVLDLLITLH